MTINDDRRQFFAGSATFFPVEVTTFGDKERVFIGGYPQIKHERECPYCGRLNPIESFESCRGCGAPPMKAMQ